MANEYAVPLRTLVKYTGANSAEIIAAMKAGYIFGQYDATITSESAGTLTIKMFYYGGQANQAEGGYERSIVIHTNERMLCSAPLTFGDEAIVTEADWGVKWTPRPDTPAMIATMQAGMNMTQAVGLAPVNALLAGASQTNIVVTFTNGASFPNTSYRARTRAYSGVSVLSALTIVETSRTTTSITFTATATGVATLAGLILVDAYWPIAP